MAAQPRCPVMDLGADPSRLVAIALSAVVAYFATVAILRVSGKRTLAEMNAFDFVVNVALGSILASTIVSATVPLVEGLTALALLVGLQTAVAFLAARFAPVRKAVKADPTLVVHRGKFLDDAMARARLAEADVFAAIRSSGIADLAGVHAVVLEANGALSVIASAPDEAGRPLRPLVPPSA